jgi:hypothetical protein
MAALRIVGASLVGTRSAFGDRARFVSFGALVGAHKFIKIIPAVAYRAANFDKRRPVTLTASRLQKFAGHSQINCSVGGKKIVGRLRLHGVTLSHGSPDTKKPSEPELLRIVSPGLTPSFRTFTAVSPFTGQGSHSNPSGHRPDNCILSRSRRFRQLPPTTANSMG